MRYPNSARRRGTSVAAAALSLALVAPVVQPVAGAQEESQPTQNTSSLRALPDKLDPKCTVPGTTYQYGATNQRPEAIPADGLANRYVRNGTGMTNAAETLSGQVFMAGHGAITNGQTGSKLAVPNGTKVYMQWRDKDGAMSPIYATETHDIPSVMGQGGPGSYVFDLRGGFYDNQGNHHKWTAGGDQYYRVWVEPQVNEESGNLMYPLRAGDGIRAYFRSAAPLSDGRATGQTRLLGKNLQRVDRWMGEVPIDAKTNDNYMKAQNVVEMEHTGVAQRTGNQVKGRVWLESGKGADAQNTLAGPSYQGGKDAPAPEYKVYLTTLSPKGVAGLSDIGAQRKVDRTKETRDRILNNPDYLDTTYVATTDDNGWYSIDGIKTTNFGDTMKNVFMWVEDSDGVIVQAHSAFTQPLFIDATGANNWRPTAVAAKIGDLIYNQHFAITSTPQEANIGLYVKNFDQHEFPARPGQTAELLIDGTVPLQDTKIVWVNSKGEAIDPATGQPAVNNRGRKISPEDYAGTQVKKCGDEATANFTVPADAKDGEIYTALLYVGTDVRTTDSFMVTRGLASEYEPVYEDTVAGEQNGEVSSKEPVFYKEENGEPVGEVVDKPEGVTFALGEGAPEGAKVDDNGVVTLPQSPRGSEPVQIPVIVKYPATNDASPSRDLVFVTFDSVPEDKDNFEPVYSDTQADPEQKDITIGAPSWQDKDGRDVEAPKGSNDEAPKFALVDKELPGEFGRRNVSVDPNTGAVTVNQAPKKPGVYEIPVEVTYPDRSKETVYADLQVLGDVDRYDPIPQDQNVDLNASVKPEDSIANKDELPAKTKYAWANEAPKTDKSGRYPAVVEVTYPDGTSETVDATIIVTGVTVHDGDVKEVKPDGTKQDTGIVVDRTTDNTEVTAKDEDGNDIPVDVDDQGHVHVTPPTDVDGPITVIVSDPSLPEDIEVDVPVKGHEGGRDDNGDGKPKGKTTVEFDTDDLKPLSPENKDQQPGITVKNPEGTKISAKDKDGNDVPVKIDEDGNVVITPGGEDINGPVTVTIKDKDLQDGEVTVEVPVKTTVATQGEPTVKPVDEDQKPGITVRNADEDTKVTAQDEDGNKVQVTIDKDGNVVINPTKDPNGNPIEVDGPITVTITDKDLPGGKTDIEVAVDGHKKDQDDNNSENPGSVDNNDDADTTPGNTGGNTGGTGTDTGDNQTSVDTDKTPNTVVIGDGEQGTGITVTNPDKDTKYSATDEDGNDVAVTIDPTTGEIKVNPDKDPNGNPIDVDGSITVIVKDPDLPGGQVDFKVPVKGHTDGQDDNANGTPTGTETRVDKSGVKTVEPTDVEQDTGVKIFNKDAGTKVSAKDEDGKDIPVTFKDGTVYVTPGTDVDGPIILVIEDTDLPGGSSVVLVPVEGHKWGTDDNNSKVQPNYGSVATPVEAGEKETTEKPFDDTLTKLITDTSVTPKNSNGWTFTVDAEGAITGTAPTRDELDDLYRKKLPKGTTSWADFEKAFEDIATMTATGEITLKGDKKARTGKAEFALVGKDGKSILDPEGDFDGDGKTNEQEITEGTSPFLTPEEEKAKSVPEASSQIDRKQCVGTLAGLGLPLILLVPLGIATMVAIPGLEQMTAPVRQQLQNANTELQKQLGIMNPQLAAQAEELNKQLRAVGTDLVGALAGLALVAAGITAITFTAVACAPRHDDLRPQDQSSNPFNK